MRVPNHSSNVLQVIQLSILMNLLKETGVWSISLLQMQGSMAAHYWTFLLLCCYLSSAVIEHTNRVIYLEDNDVAAVTVNGGNYSYSILIGVTKIFSSFYPSLSKRYQCSCLPKRGTYP